MPDNHRIEMTHLCSGRIALRRGRPFEPASRRVLCVLLLSLLLPSCATIAGGSASALRIDSNVTGAKVRVLDHDGASVYEGITPCSVVVDHGRAYFRGADYTVEVSCDGAEARSSQVSTSINEWYLANALVPGGLVGSLLVDPWTGAMFELDTHEVVIPLNVRVPLGAR